MKKKRKSIKNKTTITTSSKTFQRVVCNLTPTQVRNDTMADKDYLVVPMVMLLEGVHAGSEGAYYYPAGELAKRVELWNNKPVVVYHPSEPSACTPQVLNTRGIGVIMNTKWDDGKLSAEAWLEKSRVEKVDNRIMEAITNGDVLELSTGLFADSDETVGDWNGEEFQGTLYNFGADHLAILPDQVGACSVADGAGFFRNQKGEQVQIPRNWMQYFNELSQETVRESLRRAISVNEPAGEYWYIEDVFDTYFVYSTQTALFKQGYAVDGNDVQLEGIPSAVQRVVTYESLMQNKGKQKPAKKVKNRKDIAMNKKEKLIAALIANAATKFDEDDREFLNGLDEGRLEQMLPEEVVEEAVVVEETVVVENAQPAKTKDVEAYLADSDMPDAIKNSIRDGLARTKEETDSLVGKILGNEKNTFSEEFLRAKTVNELRGIVNLFDEAEETNTQTVIPMFNYQGQGDPLGTVATNVPTLPTPVMNFGKQA